MNRLVCSFLYVPLIPEQGAKSGDKKGHLEIFHIVFLCLELLFASLMHIPVGE